jgi:ESCRT-I complex subunit VPS28
VVDQPSSLNSKTASGSGGNSASEKQNANARTTLVVAATENFITLLDAIQLRVVEKDTLHPLLVDIIQAANKVTDQEFENKGKIVQWLIALNQMKAADKLTEEQTREFEFDMRLAYNGFKATLAS